MVKIDDVQIKKATIHPLGQDIHSCILDITLTEQQAIRLWKLLTAIVMDENTDKKIALTPSKLFECTNCSKTYTMEELPDNGQVVCPECSLPLWKA